MATITWTFPVDFQDWTFADTSQASSSAFRSYVTGAIRNTIVTVAGNLGRGENTSPTGLNVPTTGGDTIELDYSAPSDAPDVMTKAITAHYTDVTTDFVQISNAIASTLTLGLDDAKTLDKVVIEIARQGVNTTATCDILEVRVNYSAGATAGKLRTPAAYLGGIDPDTVGQVSKIASISADGLNIYLAAFDELNFPVLIKISSALSADGTIVFPAPPSPPSAGTRLGVRCGRANNNVIWIAGEFGGTDTVALSDDAGSSFSIKDDGSFGEVRAFELGPDSDNRLIIYDEDNDDLIETLDGGATWTIRNGTVTQDVNDISRFSQNLEEIVIINNGGVSDSINYSPNTGVNLEDYQSGVYPNENGTGVIAI